MSDPKPPTGYTVQDLPDFLRASNQNTKVVPAARNNTAIATVDVADPNTIKVREPQLFTNPVYTHESTHVYQMSRNPGVVKDVENRYATGKLPAGYDYGGVDGLLKAQQQRKTIAHFGPEQQARMVEDYQRQTKEAMAAGNAALLDKITKAYHPFIQQLAGLPGKNDSMTTMTKADLTPAAPGPPAASVSGVMYPDKLLGGQGKVVPPKGYKLEKR
jgi:hypothetical protein